MPKQQKVVRSFFFPIFIEFVTILLLLYVLIFWPGGMWNLSSLTRDQTLSPALKVKSYPLDHQ